MIPRPTRSAAGRGGPSRHEETEEGESDLTAWSVGTETESRQGRGIEASFFATSHLAYYNYIYYTSI